MIALSICPGTRCVKRGDTIYPLCRGPSLTTGFTDSRLVRPLGMVTYGFSPGHPAADLNHPAGVHGANESSEVATLLFRTKLLLALALELLG